MSTEEIFARAIELNSSERAEFLAEACAGDPDVMRKVDQLLSAHFEDDSLFGGADMESTTVVTGESIGESIGPYKLLQKLGEGGMGAVYMAERLEPVKQRVALKVIKSGMDSKKFVARFEAERQALAMMDHPNIAKVFDAGTTETGRPYFVMELVKGIPITTFCNENKISARDRIELMRDVCKAVQHAHQKGIIHRDLKPSNVLVAMYDDRPVCKVIDFGLAKAANQTLTEKTLFTEVGSIVGTWEYMSPEQAVFNQLDVDTRTDVYSLGVLLYELMTGAPPLDRKRLREVQLREMLRIIQEEEPPKPSTRLSSNASDPKSLATYRTTPQELTRFVRGDLDWITMRALAKDRKRRYESASRLDDDLRNFLAGNPVDARPPTWSYLASKFVRRYKMPIAAASIAFVGLVASTCIIAALWNTSRKLTAKQTEVIAALDQKQRQLKANRYETDLQNAYYAWLDNDIREAQSILSLYEDHESKNWTHRYLQKLFRESDYETVVATPSPLELACSPVEDLLIVSNTTDSHAFTVFRNGKKSTVFDELPSDPWTFHYAAFSPSGDSFLRSSVDQSQIVVHDSSSLAVKRTIVVPEDVVDNEIRLRFGRARFVGDTRIIVVVPEFGILDYDISESSNRVTVLVQDDRVKLRTRLAVSSDGQQLLYSAGQILTAVRMDSTSSQETESVETESNIIDLRIMDDLGLLVTASKNGTVQLRSTTTLKLHRTLLQFRDEARCLAYNPDRNQLVVGARDRQAVVFDTQEFTKTATLRDTNGLYALAFDRNGVLLFGASQGRVCRVGNRSNASELIPVTGRPDTVEFIDQHRLLIRCRGNGPLVIVDSNDGTAKQVDPGFTGAISAVSKTIDGSVLIVDSATKSIVRMNLDSLSTESLGTFKGDGKITAIGWIDGEIYVGTDAGKAFHFEASESSLFMDSGTGSVRDFAYSEQAGLYVSTANGTVCKYQKGKLETIEFQGDVRGLQVHENAVAVGLFHSRHKSGNLFARVGDQPLLPIRGHTFSIVDLQFFQDGRTIVTAGADRRLKFWDRDNGQQRFSMHLDGVPTALSISADERTIAIALRDGSVQILRTAN